MKIKLRQNFQGPKFHEVNKASGEFVAYCDHHESGKQSREGRQKRELIS